MTKKVLGIDVGLSGVRAAVFDDSGRLCGLGSVVNTNSLMFDDSKEHNVTAMFDGAVTASKKALAAAGFPSVQGVGVGALGPYPVLVNKFLNPVLSAPLFSLSFDADFIHHRLQIAHNLPSGIPYSDHALPKILWLKEKEPTRFRDTVMVLDMTGYIVAKLTGCTVIDPISAAYHLIDGVDNPLPIPDVLPAQEIAGGVQSSIAAYLGIPEGTPVSVGSFDSYVDMFGAGVVDSGACVILGSTLILGRIVDRELAGEGLCSTRHIGRGWFFGGWTSTAGSLIKWASEITTNTTKSNEVQKPPGSAGVVVLPYFAGERAPVWDPCARGAIVGTTLSTTATDLKRAVIDGVALSALDLFHRLERIAGAPACFRATGGGIKNSLWTQAVADALDCPLEVVSHAGEALGPAMLAFRAIGNPVSIPIAHEVTPIPDHSARYRELYNIYADLYVALANTMHRLDLIEKGKGDSG